MCRQICRQIFFASIQCKTLIVHNNDPYLHTVGRQSHAFIIIYRRLLDLKSISACVCDCIRARYKVLVPSCYFIMGGMHANIKSSNLHFLHTSALLTISMCKHQPEQNTKHKRRAKQKSPKMILTESNLLNQKESESITFPPLSPSMAQFMSDRARFNECLKDT